MGYNKFISYGSNLEVYEYEKDIYIFRGAVKRSEKPVCSPDLGADGANPLPERQLGKRQDNARRASMAFRRLVSSNLSRVELPLLLTITYADNQTDIRQGYKDFTSFVQALRYKFGKNFRYISVQNFKSVERFISTLSSGGYPLNYFYLKGKLERLPPSGVRVLYF